MAEYPATPDQRYFVVRGRMWRQTNTTLDSTTPDRLISELTAACRCVRDGKEDVEKREHARERANDVKVALGERGPHWWNDGSPDYNRYLVRNTPYVDWYAILEDEKQVRRFAFHTKGVSPTLHLHDIYRRDVPRE